jgi:hypothetical protein
MSSVATHYPLFTARLTPLATAFKLATTVSVSMPTLKSEPPSAITLPA